MGPHESHWLLLFVYRKNVDIDIEKRCPHLINVFVPLACLTLLKSLVCAYLLPVSITIFDWSLLYEKLQSARGERASYGPPKVREKHWQAQVVRLNTFGASKSHRHLVVIHQHMRWNVSPSLNIVSAGIQLMHGSFLSGARWRTVLAGSANTHTFMSTLMPCTYISLYLTQDLINRLSLAWPL